MSETPGEHGGWAPPAGASGTGAWQPPQTESPFAQRGEYSAQAQPQAWQQPSRPQFVHTGGHGAGHYGTGQSETSGKATASLVLGILGLIVLPLICSVAALVLGYQARNEIDRSGGRLGGRGTATAGVVLGWIGLVLGLLIAVAVIAFLAGGVNDVDVGGGAGEI